MGLLILIAVFVERKTVFGRLTYLLGANSVAARLSGINTARTVITLYVLVAVCAAPPSAAARGVC